MLGCFLMRERYRRSVKPRVRLDDGYSINQISPVSTGKLTNSRAQGLRY